MNMNILICIYGYMLLANLLLSTYYLAAFSWLLASYFDSYDNIAIIYAIIK